MKIVQQLVEGTKGVGYKTDLAGTPYSLSEDFVSSYRMHPLLPDDYFIAGDEVCMRCRQHACKAIMLLLAVTCSQLCMASQDSLLISKKAACWRMHAPCTGARPLRV
jgi:hypothetical protein